ncbi:LytTR family DNA-binding domain-containing protein [Eubacteriales bacterium OttesenSCG-928-M02]|nr:LytTR family DNA-binding domain-containing protein [Eubacteriales bacterium OttesenSCG-928-M02]
MEKTMYIGVCDDCAADRQALIAHINTYFENREHPIPIKVYGSGEELLSRYHKDDIGVLFLDIYMNELNGMEVARRIRAQDERVQLIFTTTSMDYALEGYGVGALQYLLKPVSYEGVRDALSRCKEMLREMERSITILSNRMQIRVSVGDIRYIEVEKNRCVIHTKKGEVITYTTLSELEQQLGGAPFLRTHRSYLINMDYVNKVMENDFLMDNRALVPIRIGDKTQTKQQYLDYIWGNLREEH